MTAGLVALPSANTLAEGLYFGASGGVSKVEMASKSELDDFFFGAPANSSVDDTGNSYGLQVGYRWNPYLAAEIGYVDLGHAMYKAAVDGTPVQLSARFRSYGVTLSALGLLPLGKHFELHGRGGVYFGDTQFRIRADDFSTGAFDSFENDGNSKDLFLGVGATWNINATHALRLEYQRFLDVGDDEETGEGDVDLLTIGILFR